MLNIRQQVTDANKAEGRLQHRLQVDASSPPVQTVNMTLFEGPDSSAATHVTSFLQTACQPAQPCPLRSTN